MSKLIFFVDDDKSILNLLEYTFKSRDGFEVETFKTGEDCLNSLDKNPDLIVLDHNFSLQGDTSQNGIDILKKIMVINSKIPTIILSQEDSKAIMDEYKKVGAAKYILKKDYFVDLLLSSIKEILSK